MGTILGTPLYMPPGQMTGDEGGSGIDMYSFACIAYELVAGRPLFEGRTTRGLLQDKLTRHVPEAWAVGPGISDELHALLVGALDNDAAKRLESFAGVAAWNGTLDPRFLARLFDGSR